MVDADLINRISELMKSLSPKQKMILSKIIESKEFKIIDYNGQLTIKTRTEDLYELIRYLKSN
jgi:FixJ family two-component response regulator